MQSWTIGQCLYKYKDSMKPYASDIFKNLSNVLKNNKTSNQIKINSAITMSRLFRLFGNLFINNFNNIAVHWMNGIENFVNDHDKIDAMNVLLDVVSKNPEALLNQNQNQNQNNNQNNVEIGIYSLFSCMMNFYKAFENSINTMNDHNAQNINKKFIWIIGSFYNALGQSHCSLFV